PGPRQVWATFHTPPVQASSSKPPGAQAEASRGSFAVHAFPTAGGPDGCTVGRAVLAAPPGVASIPTPASGASSMDAAGGAGGLASTPPSAAEALSDFLHAGRKDGAKEIAVTARSAVGMERMASEGNIASPLRSTCGENGENGENVCARCPRGRKASGCSRETAHEGTRNRFVAIGIDLQCA